MHDFTYRHYPHQIPFPVMRGYKAESRRRIWPKETGLIVYTIGRVDYTAVEPIPCTGSDDRSEYPDNNFRSLRRTINTVRCQSAKKMLNCSQSRSRVPMVVSVTSIGEGRIYTPVQPLSAAGKQQINQLILRQEGSFPGR